MFKVWKVWKSMVILSIHMFYSPTVKSGWVEVSALFNAGDREVSRPRRLDV